MLGVGGMGVVYAATHPVIGKRAAVKVLRPELSREPAAVERFVTEARSVNQIGHPNIVDIFAFGTTPDGRSYYVMDLLAGESLRARLKRSGALHISEAANVIDETASALMAAHEKGIIHRDLKPDNVFMVSTPGRWPEVKLLDWGLAKLVSPTNKFRTLTGSVLGTPVYMSPEQARAADTVDFRTDIYSLGVMSYELLAGEPPFRKRTTLDTIIAHQEDRPPPLADRVFGLPEELLQLIEAMLAKSPDDRPTLAAVHTVLKRLKGNKIPTMTAAGLEMSIPPVSVLGEPGGEKTIDDKLLSVQLTSPRFESHEVRTRPPQRSGPPELASIAPLPPPPDPPSAELRATTPPGATSDAAAGLDVARPFGRRGLAAAEQRATATISAMDHFADRGDLAGRDRHRDHARHVVSGGRRRDRGRGRGRVVVDANGRDRSTVVAAVVPEAAAGDQRECSDQEEFARNHE